ncbi:MAG: ABC transporter ATP-binding protein, partial [Tepidisphaeraceae bacterium]
MTVIHAFRDRVRRALRPGASTQIETDDEQRYRPIEWPLIRRLLSCLAPYRTLYITAMTFGLIHVMLEMLSPQFISAMINYATAFATGDLSPTVTRPDAIRHALLIIGIWAGVFIVSVILQRFTILFMTRAGESVQFDLRRRLFSHLQVLSMSFYDKTKLGRIISRCTSDVSSLREVNVWGIWRIVANALQMILAAGMLLFTDWRLFLAVAWLGVALFLLNRAYLRRAMTMWQIAREGFTRVSTNLAENITGMRVVTAFNRQDPNLGVFNNLQQINTANNVAVSRFSGIYQALLQVIGYAGKIILLTLGAYLFATGNLRGKGVGAVVAALLYWEWFMQPILNFGDFYTQMLMAMAGAERVFSLLDLKPEVQDQPGAAALARIVGHVRFESVTFGYNPERPVLHDIDFEARPGEMFALVGPTGGGKSSIISLIARFYQPQQGAVRVDEQDIRAVTGDSLHRQMGLVLQVNYLFSGTVLDNIRYANPSATRDQVIAAAKTLGSHE